MQPDERHADDGDGICLNGRGGGGANCTKSIHIVLGLCKFSSCGITVISPVLCSRQD